MSSEYNRTVNSYKTSQNFNENEYFVSNLTLEKMKRIFLIAIAGLFFASCDKTYTCQCTSPKDTREFEMAVSKKTNANDKCLQYQRQYNAFDINISDPTRSNGNYTCTVK